MRPELQDIVDEVSHLLSAPATLEDRDFNLVAFCSQSEEIDAVRQQSILQRRSTTEVRAWFEQFSIAASHEPVRTPGHAEYGVVARLCLPARWNGVTYGYLWLLDERHEIDDALLPAAMVLADRAGALLAQQARTRENLEFTLQDLLSAYPDTVERAAAEIAGLGIVGRDVPVTAVVLRLAAPRPAHTVPMNVWSLPRSVLAAQGDDHTTLLVPLVDPGDPAPARDVARRALELYAERLDPPTRRDLVAGIGAPRPDLAQARGSWREARLATRVGDAVPAVRPIAEWPALGVYRLLACGPERILADAVLDPAVRRLHDHGDPDLVRTAAMYLDHAGNVQRTAAALGVHRQTLYYRLQRIEQVTGLDLSSGSQRLLLHLGLTMAPLLTAPDSGPGPR